MRRALTQVGGSVEVWAGKGSLGNLLASALEVETVQDNATPHVHGFHSYPARMHPATAHRLIQGLCQPGQSVLDPFAGSGTVLVEARMLGRCGIGIDANPLAVALAQLKANGIGARESELWLGVVEAIAEHADQRRCAKAGPTRKYSPYHRAAFDPHVLLELDGLLQGIEQQCPEALVPALKLVLSSIINKVSRRRSDTDGSEVERRLASGFAIRFFIKKARELAGRLDDYAKCLPKDCPAARIGLGDARRLLLESGTVDAIITSPPYPGIYDYVEHHRLRLELLGMDTRHLERHEIGAHRHFARRVAGDGELDAEAKWAAQLGACLGEMRRVMLPNGKTALLIADSAVAGRAWHADRALQEIVPRHGLAIVGGASQCRTHFHAPTREAFRATQRREHLIVLERSSRSPEFARDPAEPRRETEHRRVPVTSQKSPTKNRTPRRAVNSAQHPKAGARAERVASTSAPVQVRRRKRPKQPK